MFLFAVNAKQACEWNFSSYGFVSCTPSVGMLKWTEESPSSRLSKAKLASLHSQTGMQRARS